MVPTLYTLISIRSLIRSPTPHHHSVIRPCITPPSPSSPEPLPPPPTTSSISTPAPEAPPTRPLHLHPTNSPGQRIKISKKIISSRNLYKGVSRESLHHHAHLHVSCLQQHFFIASSSFKFLLFLCLVLIFVLFCGGRGQFFGFVSPDYFYC